VAILDPGKVMGDLVGDHRWQSFKMAAKWERTLVAW
jgi:hypothetical protein